MPLTRELVERINAEVNAAVTYVPDAEKYRRDDWWEDALDEGNEGDCEDYAIAKLRKLLAAGADRDALKLGLCYVETGEYHCVLVATVDGEDLVLDNRHEHVVEWDLLPYRWDRFYLFGERAWRAAATKETQS